MGSGGKWRPAVDAPFEKLVVTCASHLQNHKPHQFQPFTPEHLE